MRERSFEAIKKKLFSKISCSTDFFSMPTGSVNFVMIGVEKDHRIGKTVQISKYVQISTKRIKSSKNQKLKPNP